MIFERRITDSQCWDPAFVLAILYTMLYGTLVILLIFVAVPPTNEKTVDTLFGIMSAIQLAIVGRYFGGSKNAEDVQRVLAQGRERTDSTLREIIREAVPAAAVPNGPGKPIKAEDVKVEAAGDVTVTKP